MARSPAAEVVRGYVHPGARLRIGHSTLVVHVLDDEVEHRLAAATGAGCTR